MNTALALTDVRKYFGRRAAVDGVTLSVAAGERVALLGHNGAGKSTLMKLALGILRPDRGAVASIGGQVGFLPENVSFHPAMTGREILAFYAALKRRPAAEVADLLEGVGLTEAAGRFVATYSKGMRQRLGLAQALLGRPRLLLLDEPTTGLDPLLRRRFHDIVRDLAMGGAGVLLSSHLLTDLEARTDRVAIMARGRLVALGTLDQLRRETALPVRIRVIAADGRAAEVAGRLGGLDLAVPPAEKMAALRRVLALGPLVADVEVEPPGLDAIYARYAGTEAEA
ncbi:MAG: ABC transporter ATP-binding protein [Pseudomonadota bacterium]